MKERKNNMFGTNELNFSILAIAGTVFVMWIVALLADNFEYEDKIQRLTGNLTAIIAALYFGTNAQYYHNTGTIMMPWKMIREIGNETLMHCSAFTLTIITFCVVWFAIYVLSADHNLGFASIIIGTPVSMAAATVSSVIYYWAAANIPVTLLFCRTVLGIPCLVFAAFVTKATIKNIKYKRRYQKELKMKFMQ